MADKGNFRKGFIVASGFYESQSTMAEKALWNVSGLECKESMAGSQPHKE